MFFSKLSAREVIHRPNASSKSRHYAFDSTFADGVIIPVLTSPKILPALDCNDDIFLRSSEYRVIIFRRGFGGKVLYMVS